MGFPRGLPQISLQKGEQPGPRRRLRIPRQGMKVRRLPASPSLGCQHLSAGGDEHGDGPGSPGGPAPLRGRRRGVAPGTRGCAAGSPAHRSAHRSAASPPPLFAAPNHPPHPPPHHPRPPLGSRRPVPRPLPAPRRSRCPSAAGTGRPVKVRREPAPRTTRPGVPGAPRSRRGWRLRGGCGAAPRCHTPGGGRQRSARALKPAGSPRGGGWSKRGEARGEIGRRGGVGGWGSAASAGGGGGGVGGSAEEKGGRQRGHARGDKALGAGGGWSPGDSAPRERRPAAVPPPAYAARARQWSWKTSLPTPSC